MASAKEAMYCWCTLLRAKIPAAMERCKLARSKTAWRRFSPGRRIHEELVLIVCCSWRSSWRLFEMQGRSMDKEETLIKV